MTDLIGKTILHYQILQQLGQGGMGIVYKARDTRLLRDVAIKILPSHLITDEKSRLRFMQEARATSALNHTNICAVYDIGQFDAIHFIVMEYVEGQTLREILEERGPLYEKEVAEIALQVCSALQAAHARGIVHRDIKPDNILRTKHGLVKITDFGLAKLAGAEEEHASPSKPAVDAFLISEQFKTSVSSLEGTARYMAPEQIRKQPVDRRTDIYALGVVMYELLTGIPPFTGADIMALMSSILHDAPKAPATWRPHISKSMAETVGTMLAKSPQQRHQSMADLHRALNMIVSPPAKIYRQRSAIALTASIAVLLMILIATRWFFPGAQRELVKLKEQSLVLTSAPEVGPVFSPDGKQIAYVTIDSDTYKQGLHIRELYSGKIKTVYRQSRPEAEPDVASLDWSPDGRWIAVHKVQGGIGLIATSGDHGLITLTDFGYTPKWSPDGLKIAFSSYSPFLVSKDNAIWLYGFADSSLRKVSPANLLSYDSPAWSPDSRWLVCLGGTGSEKALWLLDVETGEAKQFLYLQGGVSHPKWSLTGNYVYFKTQVNDIAGLYRVRVSLPSAELVSGPELVMSNVHATRFDISCDGKKLLYGLAEDRYELWRLPLDRDDPWQEANQLFTFTEMIGNISIASDGKTIALEIISGHGTRRAIVLFDSESRQQRILYDKQPAFAPSWSRDGHWVAFDAGGGNNADIWRVPSAGGKAEKIIDRPGADWLPTYSPTSDALCFLSNYSEQFDLWLVSLTSGHAQKITNTPETESGGYWSHDGKWLAYFRNAVTGDSAGVWLYDVANKAEEKMFHFSDRRLDILTKIVWHHDNSAIYFHDEIGLAKLVLGSQRLSYPLGSKKDLYVFYKYDIHENHLYFVKTTGRFGSIWLATGLE